MADRLTNRQEAFVQAIVAGKSQRQAYKDAGYKMGTMSESSIDVEAWKIMQKPKVAQRLREVQGALREEVTKRSIMSAAEVLESLTEIAKNEKEVSVKDRIRAMELMGKYHALFTEKVQNSGSVDINVTMEPEVEELAR